MSTASPASPATIGSRESRESHARLESLDGHASHANLESIEKPRTSYTNMTACDYHKGYVYNPDDRNPLVERRLAPWLAGVNSCSAHGLYVGKQRSIKKGEIITMYSGCYLTIKDNAAFSGDTRYLKGVQQFENGRQCIDGFRLPKNGHGLAQFANDFHGCGRPHNAKLVTSDLGSLVFLRATTEIAKDEEILINYGAHYFVSQ